jgi:hypothetical protein
MRIGQACSSCSAWERRSAATKRAGVEPSAQDAEVVEHLLDLLACVHHVRSIGGNGLPKLCISHKHETYNRIASPSLDLITLVK